MPTLASRPNARVINLSAMATRSWDRASRARRLVPHVGEFLVQQDQVRVGCLVHAGQINCLLGNDCGEHTQLVNIGFRRVDGFGHMVPLSPSRR
jgi:hypothetical protein